MREELETRLASLRAEFTKGQEMLRDAERQQAQLSETLIRISGAIQILEELLGPVPYSENGSVPVVDPADRPAVSPVT
jgi:predicted nuclease with TOPRIM domain